MSALIDLTGQRFGRWTVLSHAGKKGKHAAWFCSCDCGKTGIVRGDNLREGGSISCGCYSVDLRTKHGHRWEGGASLTYKSWINMKSRCTNPNNNDYKNYGGRGILVCERWIDSFENFLADMGERSRGTSIDRIDPNGNYEPGNCRWSTPYEQTHNRRKKTDIAEQSGGGE